jgi:hypothetical protein
LGSNLSAGNTEYGKRKGKLLLKIEEISGGKAHTQTHGNLFEIF